MKSNEKDWNQFLGTSPNDTVADLGAGTGFLLDKMNVRAKFAVEINDHARDFISKQFPDIRRYKYPEDVPSESIDILISTSVVEHMECPITELREMSRTVKSGGRIVRF